MPNSGKKRVRPSGRVKGDATDVLLPGMVSKLQIPKVAITRRVKDKPDASTSNDQSTNEHRKAASVHHAGCSPKPSRRVAESAPSPPTPQPILVLDPVVPHESASLQRNLRSTASKSADAGAGRHRMPPLENGQAIYKYMQNLAEEAGQVLPQDEERPRRKRKGKAEEGSLLQKLQESWGGMSYMQRLELAAQENSEHAKADGADSSAPNSPTPGPSPQPAIGDSPMGGVVQQQYHSSRKTRAHTAASPDPYPTSFAFATEPEQPKAPTPSFTHPTADPVTHPPPSITSPDGPQTVRKAIPDMRHQAEAMAAALGLFQEPAEGRPAAIADVPAAAQPVARLTKRASRKSLAGDLLPKQQPAAKQAKPATSRAAAGRSGALEPIPEPKQQPAAAPAAPAGSTAGRSSGLEDAQEPKQQAAPAAPAVRVSSSGRDAAQKENKEAGLASKRSVRSSVVLKEPPSAPERTSGAVPATPGPTSRSSTAEDAKRARADNVAISRLQQQYEAKCDELAASHRRNGTLEQQLRETQEQHSKSQLDCSAKGKKCAALEKELASSREECKKHKAAYQKAQAEKLSLSKQLEASQQEVRALKLRASQAQKVKGGALGKLHEQHGKMSKMAASFWECIQELETNDSS